MVEASKEEKLIVCWKCKNCAKLGNKFCEYCGARLYLPEPGIQRLTVKNGLKRFSLVVIFLFLISFTVYYVASVNSFVSTDKFASYSNQKYGFSFMYPSSWTPVSNESAIFVANGINASLSLFYNGEAGNTNASSILNQMISETGIVSNQFTTISNTSVINSSGNIMVQLSLSYEGNSFIVTLFEAKNNYFSLVCGTSNQEFNYYIATCNTIVNTIRIT